MDLAFFMMCSPLDGATTFFFLTENKIRKKTLGATPKRKKWSMKTKSGSGGQVTYWEDTVTSHSTPLNPLKTSFY